MNFLSNKEMTKLAKSTLALVIAGSFTFSSTTAFANENDKTIDEANYQTVDLPSDVSGDSNVNNVNEEKATENEKEVSETEAPSLVPGNFFYFAKIAIEKIKLAFTFDQEKEAKILAEYAAERLAEADVLLKDGKEAEATELIEKALENISNVDNIVNEDKKVTEESEKAEEEKTNVDDGTVDVVVEEESSVNEVNELLSQNIIALKAALEKVKNPVAKAALQKNIEKSYAKLAKKIAKIEKKYDLKEEEKDVISNDKQIIDENATVKEEETVSEKNENNTTAVAPVEPIKPAKPTKQTKVEQKLEKKAAHEKAKLAHEKAKQEVKLARELAKQEAKVNHEEAKQQWKEIKNQEKQKQKEMKQNMNNKDHEHKQKEHESKGHKEDNKGKN